MKIKTNEAWLKVAILSFATVIYATSATTPAFGEIAKAFPNASPDMIKQRNDTHLINGGVFFRSGTFAENCNQTTTCIYCHNA